MRSNDTPNSVKMRNQSDTVAQAAQAERERGHYSRATLRLFYRAWHQNPTTTNLIRWMAFQRDLGYPMSARQYHRLQAAIPKGWRWLAQRGLSYSLVKQGRLLCREYEYVSFKVANTIPTLWKQEAQWRAEFLAMVVAEAEGGIAIVGNGAKLNYSGLGKQIDQHRLVFRFNQFAGVNSREEDNGNKLDVWVRAPDFKGTAPQADWLLMTGPAFQFKLQNWQAIKPLLNSGTRLVCVPLGVWRELVARLQAPPSGGLLVAYWLAQHLELHHPGLKQYLRLYGFGFAPELNSVYHQAVPGHVPNARHNWPGERAILQQMFGKGLV